MNDKAEREERLTLELLEAVGQQNDFSQRGLAQHMGVALGLANSYLKRCVRKGFIKIQQAPANRYLYYLTPRGFTEKSRLTARFLASSFVFYRRASDSCLQVFEECRRQSWQRVLLCGVSDLGEIAVLRGAEMQVQIVGIFDPKSETQKMVHRPVWKRWEEVPPHDVCVLTDLSAPLETYGLLRALVSPERILVPAILGLVTDAQL